MLTNFEITTRNFSLDVPLGKGISRFCLTLGLLGFFIAATSHLAKASDEARPHVIFHGHLSGWTLIKTPQTEGPFLIDDAAGFQKGDIPTGLNLITIGFNRYSTSTGKREGKTAQEYFLAQEPTLTEREDGSYLDALNKVIKTEIEYGRINGCEIVTFADGKLDTPPSQYVSFLMLELSPLAIFTGQIGPKNGMRARHDEVLAALEFDPCQGDVS